MSYKGARVGSTGQWVFQRVSAVVLCFYVGLHFVITHYMMLGQDPTFAMTFQRMTHSSWKFFYIGFLPIALFHGLNGIREIALDFKLGRKLQPLVTWGCILVGVFFFGLGVYAFRPFW